MLLYMYDMTARNKQHTQGADGAAAAPTLAKSACVRAYHVRVHVRPVGPMSCTYR